MIHIEKGPEPECVRKWKALESLPGNEGWKATFGTLQNPEKLEVKRALIREQHGICCYCERPIVEDESHIEHIEPQSETGAAEAIDYRNLLCSCIKERRPGKPLHCGHLRGSWNTSEFIKPFERDCAAHFAYRLDGSIRPVDPDDERARQTIEHLGLAIDSLNKMRKATLDSILLAEPALNNEDLRELVYSVAKLGADGNYTPGFPSMFTYVVMWMNAE